MLTFHTRGLDWIVTHFLTVQVRRQWKMTQFRSLPPVWETWMDFLASGLAWVSAGCGGHLGNKPVGGRTLCSFILPSLWCFIFHVVRCYIIIIIFKSLLWGVSFWHMIKMPFVIPISHFRPGFKSQLSFGFQFSSGVCPLEGTRLWLKYMVPATHGGNLEWCLGSDFSLSKTWWLGQFW